jgi:hypothetical protein
LTLLIVPAVFTLVDDVERWFGPRFRRLLTSSQETEAVSGPRAG